MSYTSLYERVCDISRKKRLKHKKLHLICCFCIENLLNFPFEHKGCDHAFYNERVCSCNGYEDCICESETFDNAVKNQIHHCAIYNHYPIYDFS